MPNIGVAERTTYDQQVRAKFRRLTETGALGVHDRVVVVDSTEGAVTVTLPNVAEAAGKIFTISAPTAGTNNVVIADGGVSMNWSNITLSTNNHKRALYSDGITWFAIAT